MNKKFTVLIGLLMAVAITSYSVSGTYAKFTEDFNASSSADIAIWDIQFVDGEGNASKEFVFDLFKTVKDDAGTLINTTHSSTTTEGEGDAAVTTTTETNVIAPGTSGSFTIKIKNNSDVKAKVDNITLSDDSGDINIQYSLGDGNWASDLSELDMSAYKTVMNTNGATVEIPVYWKWAYETGETADAIKTNDAKDTSVAGTSIKVDATITVIQAKTTTD